MTPYLTAHGASIGCGTQHVRGDGDLVVRLSGLVVDAVTVLGTKELYLHTPY